MVVAAFDQCLLLCATVGAVGYREESYAEISEGTVLMIVPVALASPLTPLGRHLLFLCFV